MKKQVLFLLLSAGLVACSSESNQEIEEKRKALQEKKAELKEQQEIAALDAEIQQLDQQLKKNQATEAARPVSTAPAGKLDEAKRGRITGDRVVMRGSNSVQSERLGNFEKNEQVDLLSHAESSNTNEAILTEAIQFYSANGSGNSTLYQLPKGKAVVLLEYIPSTDSYRVGYEHPEWGKLEAIVKANLLNNILNEKWYQVRRSNGQTGWVLGKFLSPI